MREATVIHGDAIGKIELADQRDRCSLRLSAASAAMNNGDGARGHVEMVPGGECASDIELAAFVLSHVVLLLRGRRALLLLPTSESQHETGHAVKHYLFGSCLGHGWVMFWAEMT